MAESTTAGEELWQGGFQLQLLWVNNPAMHPQPDAATERCRPTTMTPPGYNTSYSIEDNFWGRDQWTSLLLAAQRSPPAAFQ